MTVLDQIDRYIDSQTEPKRGEMVALNALIQRVMPGSRLWFLDGTDDSGKTVTNPNIGYGELSIAYAGGKSREFYRIGLSANATGLSVYIMGLEDKTYLARTYAAAIGKAKVTGYCIRFRSLKDIDLGVLEAAIRDGADGASQA